MLARIKSRLAAVSVMAFAAVLMALPAFATAPTGVEGIADAAFTDMESTITTVLAPALVGLIVLGTVVALVIRWVRKARSAG